MLSFTFIKCINYGLDYEIRLIYICTIVGCFFGYNVNREYLKFDSTFSECSPGCVLNITRTYVGMCDA